MAPPAEGHDMHRPYVLRQLANSLSILILTALSILPATLLVGDDSVGLSDEIISRADFTGGLIVHLGAGDGTLTAALHAGKNVVVQGLDTDANRIARAEEHIRGRGLYGSVSLRKFDGRQLPYVDNLVNLLVVSNQFHVTKDEILRVLRPGGRAVFVGSTGSELESISKPWPNDIDHWTHFLYDASSNAVSHDRRVAPPDSLQWDGAPRWSRSHETDMSLTAAVSMGGRLFHTIDEGPIGVHETPRDKRLLPDKCSLVARDAFNGVELWRRPIPNWGSAAWDTNRWRFGIGDQLWSAPLTLPRRLVAVDDRVYMTLGFRACISELDAATGATLREFPETLAAEEFVISRGILVARIREAEGTGQAIVALNLSSGSLSWRHEVSAIADLTLAAANGRVCFHDTKEIVALDLMTGETLWQSDDAPAIKRAITAATLVMTDDVVLFAAPPWVEARGASDGRTLWRTKTNTSFRGMPDLFAIDGLAWSGTLTTTGLDLLTGETRREIDPGYLYTDGHHVRCYRGKATENYLLWSKRGIELLDLHGDGHSKNDWVRGTCRYGLIPANGLIYAPPHPCFCYPGVKLSGFNALASRGTLQANAAVEDVEARLTRGPAFGDIAESKTDPAAWPTYRHDGARSGCAATEVSAQPSRVWSAKLDGQVTPPVLENGRVYVSQKDSHCITCLDAQDGRMIWSRTAGGAVDSPPTIHRGRVVFGCTDGFVYCLRASDGELAWRFQAAPREQMIMSYGRLESSWPVHGSVLVHDDVVYFAAGRSTYLDGGINVFGLDAVTGQVRYQKHLQGPAPDLSVPSGRAHDMDGSKNDILLCTNDKIYLTLNVFDLALKPLESPITAKWGARKTDMHLVASGGFLDDSGFDRLYWMYAERWPGLYVADKTSKAGQILVFDDHTTYGLHTFNTKFGRSPYFAPGTTGYELFADANETEPVLPKQTANHERASMIRTGPPKWSVTIPVRARAMVLAGETLFLAGPPDVIDSDDPYGAFEGRKGGRLWAVSTADGARLAEYEMSVPPVFDGMIAADQCLFITDRDGAVSCWK